MGDVGRDESIVKFWENVGTIGRWEGELVGEVRITNLFLVIWGLRC